MRNLKALGLALVAVLAFGAMAASANAAEFTSLNTANGLHEGGKVVGSANGTQIFKTTAATELPLECTETSAEATSATGTDASLTFTNIVFQGGGPGGTCKAVLGGVTFPVHVFMNGCHFEFTIIKEIAKDEFEGEVHIKCTGETKHIIVEVTKTAGGTKCTDTIGEQTVGPVIYKVNTAAGDVDVVSEAKNVVNETQGGLLNCGVANGVHNTGVYEGTATSKAFNGEGAQIDARVQ